VAAGVAVTAETVELVTDETSDSAGVRENIEVELSGAG
jgi:hypothetical protein